MIYAIPDNLEILGTAVGGDSGMVYGYMLSNNRTDIYVSNTAYIKLLRDNEVHEDSVYIDNLDDCSHRPELRELIKNVLKSGDTLILRSIGDVSNNLVDLLKTLEYLHTNGIKVVAVNEVNYSYDTYAPALKDYMDMDKLWKSVKRVKGIAKAKAEGRMGRKRDATAAARLEDSLKLYDSGQFSIRDIRRITGIANSTLYRFLKDRGKQD
ncbi:MAG TPA: recombinase family protein [Clostridia bacterium]|nr:recombinase family protein [Clostridia bacterium]